MSEAPLRWRALEGAGGRWRALEGAGGKLHGNRPVRGLLVEHAEDVLSTPLAGAESSLLQVLNSQRRHILGILEGLSEEDLRKPLLPSQWSCLGLVQHLALDVERFWFRGVVAGEQVDTEGAGFSAWVVHGDDPAAAVLALYRREIELADAVIAATPLDQSPAAWPVEQWPDWSYDSLQQIVLHVIAETATHAGHLDVMREMLDGTTWMVVD